MTQGISILQQLQVFPFPMYSVSLVPLHHGDVQSENCLVYFLSGRVMENLWIAEIIGMSII